MKPLHVAIIQKELTPYRVPFFESLSRESSLCLSVFLLEPPSDNNAGESNTSENNQGIKESSFDRQTLTAQQLGKFIYIPNFKVLLHYDVIIFPFDLRWLNLYSALLFHRSKIVLWGHAVGKNRFIALVRKQFVRRSLGYIGYEPSDCDFYRKRGVNDRQLAYMGNTVEVENSHFSPDNRQCFIFVGRLEPRKRIDCLILAFEKLCRQQDNNAKNYPLAESSSVRLRVVGSGSAESQLKKMVDELELSDRVEFVAGSYDHSQLLRYFRDAIAYVSPGHVGLGVLHAFAYGVPVITCESDQHAPEFHNIDPGVNGDVVNFNVDELAECMRQYVCDEASSREKGLKAFEYYQTQRRMSSMVNRFAEAVKEFAPC